MAAPHDEIVQAIRDGVINSLAVHEDLRPKQLNVYQYIRNQQKAKSGLRIDQHLDGVLVLWGFIMSTKDIQTELLTNEVFNGIMDLMKPYCHLRNHILTEG